MQCPKCGKESNNLRVCPFCHTQYPEEQPSQPAPRVSFGVAPQRQSGARASVTGAPPPQLQGRGIKGVLADISPVTRWISAGLVVAFAAWYVLVGREPSIPSNVVLPNLIAAPMQTAQAQSIIRQSNATAHVAMRGGELTVQFPATTFPEHRAGMLALAQQYARADEVVQGHKRLIGFYDPDGKLFARADPSTGVMLVR